MGITTKQETHRPGVFKQINKAHKTGRHRSKGTIGNEVKGKLTILFNFLCCTKYMNRKLVKSLKYFIYTQGK